MPMQHFGGKTILGDVQMANCTFGRTELTSKIYLSDHQIIAFQCAISQCSKQPLLNQVYLWFIFILGVSLIFLCFSVLIIHYH